MTSRRIDRLMPHFGRITITIAIISAAAHIRAGRMQEQD